MRHLRSDGFYGCFLKLFDLRCAYCAECVLILDNWAVKVNDGGEYLDKVEVRQMFEKVKEAYVRGMVVVGLLIV